MNTSTIAIKYVSFPFVVLAKSAKVIPIILMGAIRGVYNPSRQQYFIAVFISLGLFIFNFFKVSINRIILIQKIISQKKSRETNLTLTRKIFQ